MDSSTVSIQDFLMSMEERNLIKERTFIELLSHSPLPSPEQLLSALRSVSFTRHQALLSQHPGAEIFERLETYDRSHKLLLSFFDDLTAAHGRFQGIALARVNLDGDIWESISFSFTKTLFSFSAAAKASDEMLGRIASRQSARRKLLVDKARSAMSDTELIAFIHELRNHLSHSVLEKPDVSIEWTSKDPNSAFAKVTVNSERFRSGRWPAQAALFLQRNAKIDLMSAATSYVTMASRVQDQLFKEFWSDINSVESNYASLKSRLEMSNELMEYGILIQLLKDESIDILRFIHQRIPSKHLGFIRGLEDYSEDQFEAIARLVDPFDLMDAGLRDRLKERFTTPSDAGR